MSDKLKLMAQDTEDVTIMSAYLQDAVTNINEIVFQSKSHRFVLMLSRYVWENRCPETGKPLVEGKEGCTRIRCGLHFDGVLNVSSQHISPNTKDQALELLAIEAFEMDEGQYEIELVFSGDAIIRLTCEMISAQMQDMGEAWPAHCHPKHKILDALGKEKSP